MGGVKLRMTSDDSTHHSPSMLVKTIVFTYGDSTYIYIYIRVCFQFQAFQVSILQIHAYTLIYIYK